MEGLGEPLLRGHRGQASATAAPSSPGKEHGGNPVAAGDPLRRGHRAQANATAASSSSGNGKEYGSDPFAAGEPSLQDRRAQASASASPSSPRAFFTWRRRGSPTSGPEQLSFMQRLRVAISAPIHSAEEMVLREHAGAFAKSAAGSSMAAAADAFCHAAQQFSAKKERTKKVMDTELSKTTRNLESVSRAAPSSEAALATIAIELTYDAQRILLSDTESKPRLFFSCWKRESSASGPQDVTRPSFLQRLRAAISAPEPILPIHAEREEKLIDKREVVYALALGAPVAILTSAAGLQVFPDAWAWIAGGSLGVWILAAGGMVLNLYAQMEWERLAARHLGRLGVLGAAVLFCFFTHMVFFPSASWGFWFLIVMAAMALGVPWILGSIRGDDAIAMSGSAGDAAAAGRIGMSEMTRGGRAPGRRRTA